MMPHLFSCVIMGIYWSVSLLDCSCCMYISSLIVGCLDDFMERNRPREKDLDSTMMNICKLCLLYPDESDLGCFVLNVCKFFDCWLSGWFYGMKKTSGKRPRFDHDEYMQALFTLSRWIWSWSFKFVNALSSWFYYEECMQALFTISRWTSSWKFERQGVSRFVYGGGLVCNIWQWLSKHYSWVFVRRQNINQDVLGLYLKPPASLVGRIFMLLPYLTCRVSLILAHHCIYTFYMVWKMGNKLYLIHE